MKARNIKGENMQTLLGKKKHFYKANLHCHSTYSDGKYSVERLKEEYQKRGYAIVAFTDHEHLIDNSRLTDENFLAITACEIAIKEFPTQSTLKNFDMRVCHLNFYALDAHNTITPCYSSIYDHYITDEIKDKIVYEKEYERVYSAQGINEMIKVAREKGFIVSYNHPRWSLETAQDYLQYEGLFAVEIYNHGCVVNGHLDDERAFDDMLRSGKRIYCTAADDNHNGTGFDGANCQSFGGWVEINADNLEYGEIMNALQTGDFYASTGVKIFSLTREGEKVKIQTSPCTQIALLTRGRRTKAVNAPHGETLTETEFTLHPADGYFRIRATDAEGKKAYTQAYQID